MSIKKLIAGALFLCSTASLAGGTVTLTNRTGVPLEVFLKSNLESEVGKPIFQNGETHKVVGNKASSYSFTVRSLDPTSLQPTEKSGYLAFLIRYNGRHEMNYSLEDAGRNSPSEGPKICYYITQIKNDSDGPHDFEVDLTPCY